MSAAAKKRNNLKSGGTDKSASVIPPKDDATAGADVVSMEAAEAAAAVASSMSAPGEALSAMEIEDHHSFSEYMIKPSNITAIWSTFKVKKNMLDYMQWYFRPKNSYDPERVDYNALNILSEYQTYNLEFVRNELDFNDEQSANVLDVFWKLLEFDPDEKSIEREIGGGDKE